jgi:hypothetical protein
MIQYNGGPCAIISAVQAFLIKELLFCSNQNENWSQVSGNKLAYKQKAI